jgi:hypothetical protein
MHVSFALFCDAANISREGKLNILGVFDAIQVGSLPAVHPRANLVVRLKGGPGDVGAHTLTMRWVNPRGDELWTSSGHLDVAAPPPGAPGGGPGREMDLPLIAALDLPVDLSGEYTLHIALDDEPKTSVRLQVHGQAIMPQVGGSAPSMVS